MNSHALPNARFRVRTPKTEIIPGVRTFYVQGTWDEYTIKYNSAKRRWSCDCPDFLHRHSVVGGICKHIGRLQTLAKLAGGLRNIKRGRTTWSTPQCQAKPRSTTPRSPNTEPTTLKATRTSPNTTKRP